MEPKTQRRVMVEGHQSIVVSGILNPKAALSFKVTAVTCRRRAVLRFAVPRTGNVHATHAVDLGWVWVAIPR